MKFKHIFAILATAILAVSCEKVSDWIEKQDTGDLQFEEIWVDDNYVEGVLNNCYTAIPTGGWSYPLPLWSFTDEGWSSQDASNAWALMTYNGSFNTSQWVADRGYYSGLTYRIRNLNQFLQYIVLPQTAVKNDESRERMTAEAYVLRAYYMMELFKNYGPLYLYNIDGGTPHDEYLPMVTDLTSTYENLRRVSAEDYVRFIIADCNRGLASEALPWRITVGGDAGRMHKAVAWAIKANAMLYLASPLFNDGKDYWEEAYQMHKEALELIKANGYELYTECSNTKLYGTSGANAYKEYYCISPDYKPSPKDRETIYAYGGGGATAGGNYIGSNHSTTTSCGTCPTQEIVDCYETIDGKPVLDLENPYQDIHHTKPNFNPDNTLYDEQDPYANRDPRFEACIMHHGTVYTWDKEYVMDVSAEGRNRRSNLPTDVGMTRTGYYYCKGISPDCTMNSQKNGPGYRQYKLSELILNFAECAFEAGHVEEAREAVNEIRDRVSMPEIPAGLSDEQFKLRMLNERRVELAFEDTRFFDLRRWCKPYEDIPGIKYFSAIDVTYSNDWSAATYTRVALNETERHGYEFQCKLVPLPRQEASNMMSITGVNFQNPGWD